MLEKVRDDTNLYKNHRKTIKIYEQQRKRENEIKNCIMIDWCPMLTYRIIRISADQTMCNKFIWVHNTTYTSENVIF